MLKQTMKFLRQVSARTESHDGAAIEDPVATTELELVSTGKLQKILDSNDEKAKRSIRKAAETGDGLLAHDAENDQYKIVDAAGDEDFSLVSTQMLHRMLAKDNPVEKKKAEAPAVSDSAFDPYNSD